MKSLTLMSFQTCGAQKNMFWKMICINIRVSKWWQNDFCVNYPFKVEVSKQSCIFITKGHLIPIINLCEWLLFCFLTLMRVCCLSHYLRETADKSNLPFLTLLHNRPLKRLWCVGKNQPVKINCISQRRGRNIVNRFFFTFIITFRCWIIAKELLCGY